MVKGILERYFNEARPQEHCGRFLVEATLEVLADKYEIFTGEYHDVKAALDWVLAQGFVGVHMRFYREEWRGANVARAVTCEYTTLSALPICYSEVFRQWRRKGGADEWADFTGGEGTAAEVYSGGHGWGGAPDSVAAGWSSHGWAA